MKKNKNLFEQTIPCKPILVSNVPSGDDWIFEIKYDGYRIIAKKQNGKTKLLSKNNVDFSDRFLAVCKNLDSLKNDNFVLDGEIVCFDKDGRSDFAMLQKNIKSNSGGFVYVVFDIMFFDGQDIRNLPLEKRKKILDKNFANLPYNILKSDFVRGNGKAVFDFALAHNLEGVVAKKIDGLYDKDCQWLKIKTKMRQEFVVGGFQTSTQNPYLANILVGFFQNKKFVYAGKVGTGFDTKSRMQLSKMFLKIKTKKCWFEDLPQSVQKQQSVFLKPLFVAEISFANFSADGILRHPSFVGLRLDKDAKLVQKEIPTNLTQQQTQKQSILSQKSKKQNIFAKKTIKGIHDKKASK